MSLLLAALSLGLVLGQGQWTVSPLAPWAAAGGAVLAAALVPVVWRLPGSRRRIWQTWLPCGLAAFLLGYAWSSGEALARLAARLPPGAADRTVTALARVADLPLAIQGGLRLSLDLEPPAAAAGLPARVSVTVADKLLLRDGKPRGGDCLVVTLKLRPAHALLNFEGFDGGAWLWGQGILATGTVRAWHACPAPKAAFEALLQGVRDGIRARLQARLGDHPAGGVIVALAVGDQSGVSPDQWTLLWRTGVGHLISISGVHVTLLASVLRALAEALWRRSARACRRCPAPIAAAAVGFAAALAYALVAGFAVPTRRTLFMLAAAWIAGLRGVLPGSARIFWCAVASTLILDPFAALSPSFWLSFGAVGGLILADLGRAGPRAKWRSELDAQWVANLTLLPLLALWFGQLSVVAPLANAVAIPLVSLVVTPLTLAAMFPGCTLLAVPAARLAQGLLDLLGALGAPAWAAIDLPVPQTWTVLLAAVAIGMQLAPRGLVPGRRWALPALLPLLLGGGNAPAVGSARIEVLDIGQGLSVLVRTHGHALLFDTGPRWPGGDAGSRTIVPLLRAEGVRRLDRVLLSHPDADHVGGFDSIARAVPVAEVLSGFERPGAAPCLRGQAWRWDGVEFEVLYPLAAAPGAADGDRAHARNNHACVLRISAGSHAVLLPADIEAPAEHALIRAEAEDERLHSDLVIAAHHGSRTSSTPAFVAATRPRWVVVSLGDHNRYHHPNPAVLARWQAQGAAILRTDERGAVGIALSAQGLEVTDAATARPAYWR